MRRVLGVVVALGALALTGCTQAPSPFDGRRLADDRLPAPVASYVRNAEVDTSRFQGSADGWDLYLVRGDRVGFCLAYTDGSAERSGSTCTGGTSVQVDLPGGAAFEADLDGFVDEPADGQRDVSFWVRQIRWSRER